MRRATILSVFALVMAGCTNDLPPYQISTPFHDADFVSWVGDGPVTIEGQAFIRTIGGDVRTCAGSVVTLIPATGYNDEIYNAMKIYRSRDILYQYGIADKYNRTSVCDAQGNFEFKNIPSKPWWVQTSVFWGVPSKYSFTRSLDWEGGKLAKRYIFDGGEHKIILTGADILD